MLDYMDHLIQQGGLYLKLAMADCLPKIQLDHCYLLYGFHEECQVYSRAHILLEQTNKTTPEGCRIHP